MQFKSWKTEKIEKIKKTFLGETVGSINQVKPEMNTNVVVNDFMNGSYLGRNSGRFRLVLEFYLADLLLRSGPNKVMTGEKGVDKKISSLISLYHPSRFGK